MPRETEKPSPMMIDGKQIGGQRLGGRNKDGRGVMKSEVFFLTMLWSSHTHSVSHAHVSNTFSSRGVHPSRTRMAQGVCSAHVISLHFTLSIPISSAVLVVPTRTVISRPHSCLHSPCRSRARVKRSSARAGEEFGYLADPTHSTIGHTPKHHEQRGVEEGS